MTQQRSTAFEQLANFITNQMRMSHLYQPLMLRTLVEKGGVALAPLLRPAVRNQRFETEDLLPFAGRFGELSKVINSQGTACGCGSV
jgi:hypothetical protein